ncbi:MAG: SDR family NAD(P)-dependent oxidoreductase [Caldilineaceae bacterium]|nr:SDR family NAD(P)-dependent oxidoreductase [Caldilineaceae bacterium]
MKEFRGKVAVITGAASGIGFALAERCAQEGMKVVLADVEEPALRTAEERLRATGATTLGVVTDVSKETEVEKLAQTTLQTFGGVHLLCNNAGVSAGTTVWQSSLADWQWVLGVNLWGVIYGIRMFVPIMLAQESESHIVNTVSLAGMVSLPGMASYKVSKQGVITLSETLYHELKKQTAKVGVSVLFPGGVRTRLIDSARNRPTDLQNDPSLDTQTPEEKKRREARRQRKREQGLEPAVVAHCLFDALRAGKFYIFVQPEQKSEAQLRMDDILQEQNPRHAFATS